MNATQVFVIMTLELVDCQCIETSLIVRRRMYWVICQSNTQDRYSKYGMGGELHSCSL